MEVVKHQSSRSHHQQNRKKEQSIHARSLTKSNKISNVMKNLIILSDEKHETADK